MHSPHHYMYGKVLYMLDGEVFSFERVLVGETFTECYNSLLDQFFDVVTRLVKKILSIELKSWEVLDEGNRKLIAAEYCRQFPKEEIHMPPKLPLTEHGLTSRETRIARLHGIGMSSKAIAAELGSTENSINSGITIIRHKLEAKDRVDLLRIMLTKKIMTLEEFMGGKLHDGSGEENPGSTK